MGYSYGNIGGGNRKLANKSNVWFYPRIRLVPQSEYSYWGISDSDCLVFDTYFFSNSSWTNTGIQDTSVITSATQLPKKVFFKDATTNTSTEAYAIGYNPSIDNEIWYQSTWIKPAVIKCTTTKGYITAVQCGVSRTNGTRYYMGARPVNPDKYYEAEDTFESDETSETLKWHAATQYSTSNTPSGDYNDSYYYFLRYADSSTTTPTITYFLRQSVDKIYNYRKFYFIVPIGCNLSFGIEALDFLAYNGWKDSTTPDNLHLCKDYDTTSPCVRGFFAGTIQPNYYSIQNGAIISNAKAILDTSSKWDSSRNWSRTSFYVSGETLYGYGWEAALSNPAAVYNLNTSTGVCSRVDSCLDVAEPMEPEKSGGDVTLSSYSGSNKTLTSFISGTTINFGAPGLRYMYANGKQTGSSQYFAYLNSNCMSVNSCTLAYKKNSLTTGMDGTTLTWNSVTASNNTVSRQWTISNQHDSSGRYVTRYYIENANDSSSKLVATDSSVTIGAMSSTSNSYSRTLSISPNYKMKVYCTYISETGISCELDNPYSWTDSRKIIAIEATYISNSYSNAYIYYNNGSNSATVYNTNSSLPSTYSSAQWYIGPVTKVTATPKTYYHTCRWATRAVVMYRAYTGSWTTVYGDWTYGSYSGSSDYCYHKDSEKSITITRSYSGSRYQYWFSQESSYLQAPTIKTCTDAGSWKRYVQVYNPNPVSLTVGYSANKSSYNYRPNSQWYHTSISPNSTITLTINDQGGYSDEWVIVGFKVYDTGSSYGWACTTIDEDATSGTPNVVKSNFYYEEPY